MERRLGRQVMILAMFVALMCSAGCGTSSAPNAPTGLTIACTVSTNTLQWNAVSGAVYYNIYRGTAAGVEGPLAGTSNTTFVDTPSATASTPYYYLVTALDSKNYESLASNEVFVIPPTLTLGAVTSSSVALSWTLPASVTGVTGYNIYRSTTAGAEAAPATASTTTLSSYTDTTVTHGTTYYYRVTAVGAKGETLGSNEITAAP